MSETSTNDHRILVIDDNPAIHQDFRKIFDLNGDSASLDAEEAALFGHVSAKPAQRIFAIDSAFQGQEGVALLEKAVVEGRPYGVAFVDVRMPPGWDGIETIARLWKVYPDLQVVICTAYSDYSWEEMNAKLGQSDRLVILKKPFDNIEVLQLATTLVEKWRLRQQANNHLKELEDKVRLRTEELRASEEQLHQIAEVSPGMIYAFRKRPDGAVCIPYASAAIQEIYGMRPEDVSEDASAVFQLIHPDDLEHVNKTIAESAATMTPWRDEFRVRHPRKGEIWVEGHSVPQCEADGSILWYGFVSDITERKRANERVVRSEQLLRTILDVLPQRVFWKDREGRYLGANNQFLADCDRKEITGKTDYDMPWTREQAELARMDDFRVMKSGDAELEIIEMRTSSSGKTTWLSTSKVPLRDGQGNIMGVLGSYLDITHLKKTEEELRRKTALFEALLNSSLDGILVVNSSGQMAIQNQQFNDLLKIPPHLAGSEDDSERLKHVTDSTKNPEQFLEKVRYLYAHPDETSRDEIEFKDGAVLDRYSAPVIGADQKHYGRIWMFRDITNRKQAEGKLRLRTSALEAAANGIVICDRNGRIVWVNPAFTKLTGYTSAEAVGQSPRLLKSGQHDAAFYESLWKTILAGKNWQGEIINRRKDGTTYFEDMTITPLRDGRGEITNFIAIKQDISERKEFENALANERELLQSLMDHSPDLIYFKDLQSRFLMCSKTMVQRFGQNRVEDVLGKTDFSFFDESHARAAFEDEQQIIRSGNPVVGKIEQENWKSDGRTTWALTTKMPLRNKEGNIIGTFGISKDITELKEAEQSQKMMEGQLRQAQKLEAIGQLAAGIAHEINTPTQYVGDNTRFFKDAFESLSPVLKSHQELLEAIKTNSLAPDLIARAEQILAAGDLPYLFEQVPAAITETLEGVDRVTKIVRAMKEFSHPGGREKTPADLNKAIESTVTVARNEWKYVADLKLDLDPALPLVPCFLGEFNQAVLNLIVNASHAIQDVIKASPGTKGRITIKTSRAGDHAEVRVSDTGTGIAEAHRAHVFEPFFTTKEVGRGTGQGLSVIYSSIVKKHGGTVDFETEIGQGTTFILRLPIAAASGELPEFEKSPSAEIDKELVAP